MYLLRICTLCICLYMHTMYLHAVNDLVYTVVHSIVHCTLVNSAVLYLMYMHIILYMHDTIMYVHIQCMCIFNVCAYSMYMQHIQCICIPCTCRLCCVHVGSSTVLHCSCTVLYSCTDTALYCMRTVYAYYILVYMHLLRICTLCICPYMPTMYLHADTNGQVDLKSAIPLHAAPVQ
jgi:hypothetical protein